MGIIRDFKNLFWAKKAVTESATEKAIDKTKEVGADIVDKAAEAWDKGKEKLTEVTNEIVDKASELWEREKDKGESGAETTIGGTRREEFTNRKDSWTPGQDSSASGPTDLEKAGEKIGHAAAKAGEKIGDAWDKAKETGKEVLDKAVDTSDKVWEKAEETGKDLWSKAKTTAEKAGQKFEEGVDKMLEKAEALDQKIEEERKKIDPDGDGWADKSVREKLNETQPLKGKDDFFERAARYAEGDYSMGKPQVVNDDGTTSPDESRTELPPLPEKDLFDDAILDDEGK